jgi:hypothetical protein
VVHGALVAPPAAPSPVVAASAVDRDEPVFHSFFGRIEVFTRPCRALPFYRLPTVAVQEAQSIDEDDDDDDDDETWIFFGRRTRSYISVAEQ